MGHVVLLGDSNMITDASSAGYTAHDNGTLMRNLCPPDEPVGVSSQPVSATEGQQFTATIASASGDSDSTRSDQTASLAWAAPAPKVRHNPANSRAEPKPFF